jgi:hypothetical protein
MMQRSLPSIFSSSQGSSLPQGVMVMEVEQEQPQPRRPTQAPRFQAATESAGPQVSVCIFLRRISHRAATKKEGG